MKLRILLSLVIWTSLLPAWTGHAVGEAVESPQPHRVDPSLHGTRSEQLATEPLVLHAQVDPILLKQALQKSTAPLRFVIVMAKQASFSRQLSGADPGSDRAQVVSILQTTAETSQAKVKAELDIRRSRGQVLRYRSFWIFNGIAVTADADTLLAMAARPDIGAIRQDRWQRWVEFLSTSESEQESTPAVVEWNLAQINADLVWNILGLDGSGVTVGIMDSGVDWQHPVLQTQYRGYNPDGLSIHEGNWACTTDEGYLYPVDDFGHGTHVTGIAVGSQDPSGQAIGVAPGARWIAVKALDDAGYGYDSWLHAAFEWLMAPGGDPALAPDIVNGSWGTFSGFDDTYRSDLQALRAAGIVPVFAAGNNGPYPGTVGSPGSYPEAIAVGATDDLDQVTSFSSRGPSYWDEIKPEVSAPGAQIRSSLPGGTFGAKNGTSMASPHVAGVVALMLQADPTLSVDDIEAILTSTALPLGDQIPNNDTGWGRIDAYRAAAVALQAGYVNGQVLRQPDLQPLPHARVTAFDREGEPHGQVVTDEDGYYSLALPEGTYNVEATAFGYESKTEHDLSVQAGESITLGFRLSVAPAGVLWGQITDAATGGPVSAQILVENTPARTTSDPQTGQYSMALPADSYTVIVSQNGYRRSTADNVEIVVDEAVRLDSSLTPAPTLLLVDSGGWYYDSQATYFEYALDDSDYVYDKWEIRNLDTDIPEEADLAPFDIAIWSSPSDSPGLIGAGDVISDYLGIGGNVFLSGQDIGYWDDGLSGFLYHPYYRQFLKAEAFAGDAGRSRVVGVPGEPLDGLSLEMNGPDSAANQTSPDLIGVLDPFNAALIGTYESDGGAALRASGCQSYRSMYLAAGLEGLGDRLTRAEVMDRALTWLDTPQPGIEPRLAPSHQNHVWVGGTPVTYTVELKNMGSSAAQFDLELSLSAWPTTVWDSSFTKELTQSIELGACQTQTLGVEVTVPPDAGWNITETVTLTARSQADSDIAAEAIFSTKSPAPILLVDDHRWYDTSDSYRYALEARQLPYDEWRNAQSPTSDSDSLSLARLQSYPVVIWFTAYDWYKTLTPEEEARLAAYLDGGGRLLLSSQDYLYTSGFTDFASDYLGVVKYTEGLTVTQTVGAVGHPVGNGLAPMELVYPFRNFSDALHPSPVAEMAFWSQHGQPVALTMESAPWKTSFYAFAIEALGSGDMTEVLGNTVHWLSPLGDSTLEVGRPVATPGSELTYTLSIRNTGPRPLNNAALSNPVPPSTSFVQGSIEGPAAYDPGTQSITWEGALQPDQAITVTYRLQLDRPLPGGTTIENVARFSDETGLGLERIATSRVDSPYLGSSVKVVSTDVSPPGGVLTYTFSLQNDGLQPAEARLTDPIPVNSSHLPGSGWASSGLLTSTEELLVWSGTLAAGEAVTITFAALISPTIKGFYVHNRASLTDGWGNVMPLEAYTLVESRLFLPLILKGF